MAREQRAHTPFLVGGELASCRISWFTGSMSGGNQKETKKLDGPQV